MFVPATATQSAGSTSPGVGAQIVAANQAKNINGAPAPAASAANTIAPNSGNSTQADVQTLFNEIFSDALARLTPIMGPDAAKTKATQIATEASSGYSQHRADGQSPQEALAWARQYGVNGVTEEFKIAGKPSPYGDPNAPGGGGAGASTVGSADTSLALDQYREGVAKGKDVYGNIVSNPTNDPNARDTFKPVTGQKVGTMFVADPQKLAAAQVAAPDKPTTATATAEGAIKTTDATAAPAISPALLSPAQRLAAATQRATQVGGTTLDTGQTDESRALANQNIQDLQATAQGKGAGQVAADARTRLDIAKMGQTLAGAARAARGQDRKAQAITGQLAAAEQGANALVAREEQAAREREQAQAAVGQQAQATRSTDLAVAAKRADLQAQQAQLQAQLDAARAAGDAGREQEIRTKMADLDQQVAALNQTAVNAAAEAGAGRSTAVSLSNALEKNKAAEGGAGRLTSTSATNAGFVNTAGEADAARRLAAATTNATQTNTVNQNNVENRTKVALANQAADQSTQQFNSNQGVQVGSLNNQQGLAANVAGSQEDVAQAKLRMEAQDAIERSAKGLLDENERQNQLAIARQQLAIAQAKGDREAEQSWFDKISALVTTVGTVAKVVAPVAVGASDPRLKTNITKVSDKDLKELAKALRDSASTWTYRKDLAADLPDGPQVGFMADALQKTKLGKGLVSERPDGYLQVDYNDLGRLSTMLAAHNLTEKKRRAA